MKKITFLQLTNRAGQPPEISGFDHFIALLQQAGGFRLEEKIISPDQLAALKIDQFTFLIMADQQYDLLVATLPREIRSFLILVGCDPADAWNIDQHNWAAAIPHSGLNNALQKFWMVGHVPVVSEVAFACLPVRGNCQAFYFDAGKTLVAYLELLEIFSPHRVKSFALLAKEQAERDEEERKKEAKKNQVVTQDAAKPKQAEASKQDSKDHWNSETMPDAAIEVSSSDDDLETLRKKLDAEAKEKIKSYLFSDAFLQSRDWSAYHPTKDRKKLETIFEKEIYFAYLKLRYPKNSATEFSFWQDVKIIQRIGDNAGQADPKTVKTKDVLTLEYGSQWKEVMTIDGLVTWKKGGSLMPEVVVFEKKTAKTTAADAEKRRNEWRKLFQAMSRSNSFYRLQFGQIELKNVMASYYGINQQVLMGKGFSDLGTGWTDYVPVSASESGKWLEAWLKKLPKLKK
jgi:hypoxanthine phosphoribosyltransferase